MQLKLENHNYYGNGTAMFEGNPIIGRGISYYADGKV
jgi:hypothetical protein